MTTVTVTAEHIAKGEPRSAFSCPVVFALEDAFPGTICYAGRYDLTVYSGGGFPPSLRHPHTMRLHVPHPDSVREFIRALDSDLPVEPFTFELDYPEARPAA
jgi:hypothetical protein